MPPVALVRHTRIPICDVFLSLCNLRGGVLPRSLLFAVPCSSFALLLKLMQNHNALPSILEGMDILDNNAAYTGFSFAMGFLFVFRTSQAYSRFWEGVTAGHRMYAEWFDFASAVVAFSRYSTAAEEKRVRFHHRLVRLLSLLHGGASSTLSGESAGNFELIDLGGLEEEVINRVVTAEHPTTLIGQWITELVVEGIHDGVITAPPPIVSRCFQEFANGMVAFHDAVKIQSTDFPFPYTQMAGILLIAHALITPFVMCQWVIWPSWVFVLTFIQVLIFWSLYFTAIEIEYPFRRGDLSHDTARIQTEFNKQLLTLINPNTRRIPELSAGAVLDVDYLVDEHCEHVFSKEAITRSTSGMGQFQPFKNLRRSNHVNFASPSGSRLGAAEFSLREFSEMYESTPEAGRDDSHLGQHASEADLGFVSSCRDMQRRIHEAGHQSGIHTADASDSSCQKEGAGIASDLDGAVSRSPHSQQPSLAPEIRTSPVRIRTAISM